jgi:hypothetical protein
LQVCWCSSKVHELKVPKVRIQFRIISSISHILIIPLRIGSHRRTVLGENMQCYRILRHRNNKARPASQWGVWQNRWDEVEMAL